MKVARMHKNSLVQLWHDVETIIGSAYRQAGPGLDFGGQLNYQ